MLDFISIFAFSHNMKLSTEFVLYTGEEVYAMLRDPQKCSTSTTLTVNHNLTEAAVPETVTTSLST